MFSEKALAKSENFTKTHEHYEYFGGKYLVSGQCCQIICVKVLS